MWIGMKDLSEARSCVPPSSVLKPIPRFKLCSCQINKVGHHDWGDFKMKKALGKCQQLSEIILQR